MDQKSEKGKRLLRGGAEGAGEYRRERNKQPCERWAGSPRKKLTETNKVLEGETSKKTKERQGEEGGQRKGGLPRRLCEGETKGWRTV